MTKRESTFNDFSCFDSSYIYASEKAILPEDAVNVPRNEKDATKCRNAVLVLHGDAMSCSTKYYNFVLKMFVQELAIRKKGSLGKQNVTIVKANLNRENTFSKVFTRATRSRPSLGFGFLSIYQSIDVVESV